MKSLLMFSVCFFMLIGCGEDKAPACTDLSWEKSASLEQGVSIGLRYSAGEMCENYNEYYDGDIQAALEAVSNFKIKLDPKCEDKDYNSIECPEEIPSEINYGEMVGCSFGTPPSSSTNCAPSPINLTFQSDGFSDTVVWTYNNTENPVLDQSVMFGTCNEDNLCMHGTFENDDDLSAVLLMFIWKDGVNDTIVYNHASLVVE